MPPNQQLVVREEWGFVPVLLVDKSTKNTLNGKCTWRGRNKMFLAAMSQKGATKHLQRMSKYLGWDNLTMYNF